MIKLKQSLKFYFFRINDIFQAILSSKKIFFLNEGHKIQILTYAWHLWPLSSEGSKAWHIYSDTAHSFMMVISEVPWTSHLLASVWQWSCHYLFLRLRPVLVGIPTPNTPLAGRTLKPTAPLPRQLKDNTILEGEIIRYHLWFCSEVYC